MAIKPSEITKGMVFERARHIIDSALQNDKFQLALGVKQLANWSKAKRRQTFRLVIKNLIGGRQYWGRLSAIIKPLGINYWHIQTDIVINDALTRFVREVQKMEESERFMPEKVITISNLNTNLFLSEPETLEYLLKNNIMVLSDSLRIKGSTNKLTTNVVRNISYSIHNLPAVLKFYTSLNLNTDVLLDPRKLGVKTGYNIQKNIELISDILLKKENAKTSIISRENIEKLSHICSTTMKDMGNDFEKIFFKTLRMMDRKTYQSNVSEYIENFASQADVEATAHQTIVKLHQMSGELNKFLFEEDIKITGSGTEIIFNPELSKFSADQ
jgi:hypothetical protein